MHHVVQKCVPLFGTTLSNAQRKAAISGLVYLHPEISHNVPVHYIASFIGIKSESLSRIRKKVMR